MGLNFRKSIKLGGGVRLNVGKKGLGLSAGVKGARVGIGPRGARATTSIPGTGISYTESLGNRKGNNQSTGPIESAEPSSIDYAKRRKINKVLFTIMLFIIAFFILIVVIVNTVSV